MRRGGQGRPGSRTRSARGANLLGPAGSVLRLLTAAAVCALPLFALANCRRQADNATMGRVEEKRVRQEQLWRAFNESVASDPLLGQVISDEGQVLVAIRGSLLQGIVQDVARSYLNRVELNLSLDAPVHAQGTAKVKTKLGQVTAGTWKVSLLVQRVKGVLHAANPVVTLAGADRLGLSVPVSLQKGEGTASVHFEWDSAGLANAVCTDFQVKRTIQGRVLPDAYTLRGGLVLAATDDALLARPTLQDTRFRLRFDLTAESWAEVQAALQEQADLGKCGLALKAISAEDILNKLRALLQKGFDVRLPQSLLRTFSLPASLQRSVDVEGRHFALAVKPHDLKAAHDALWYSASVQVSKDKVR